MRLKNEQDTVGENFFQKERRKVLGELPAWADKQRKKYYFLKESTRLTKKDFPRANIYLEEMND